MPAEIDSHNLSICCYKGRQVAAQILASISVHVPLTPGHFTIGLFFGDNAACQRIFSVTIDGEPGCVKHPCPHKRRIIPIQIGEIVTIDIDDSQSRTFRYAQHACIPRLFSSSARLLKRGAGNDMIIGDGNTAGVNDEAAAMIGKVGDFAFCIMQIAAFKGNAYSGAAYITEDYR